MVRRDLDHVRFILMPLLAVGVFLSSESASALQVSGKADKASVQVGQKVMVTITATRSDSLGDPQFAGAAVHAGTSWKLGGQMTQSPVRSGNEMVKVWQFELQALVPDSTRVTPVVYLGSEPSLGQRADSILGAPVYIAIVAPPVRPVWPWVGGIVIVVVISSYLLVRSMRKKREAHFVRHVGTPLDEALEMLAAIRNNRREDRAGKYLSDLELVLNGYVSRRLGKPLSGKTASEIAAIVAGKVRNRETIERLQSILQTCSAARFGGARTSIETLVALDEQVRQTMEQMDNEWV